VGAVAVALVGDGEQDDLSVLYFLDLALGDAQLRRIMEDQYGVGGSPAGIFLELAEGVVVQAQLGKRLTGSKLEVVRREVAFERREAGESGAATRFLRPTCGEQTEREQASQEEPSHSAPQCGVLHAYGIRGARAWLGSLPGHLPSPNGYICQMQTHYLNTAAFSANTFYPVTFSSLTIV
jgi:hypothetical protein